MFQSGGNRKQREREIPYNTHERFSSRTERGTKKKIYGKL
jgi:hypothetical protein